MGIEDVVRKDIGATRLGDRTTCRISHFYDDASKIFRMQTDVEGVPSAEFLGRDVFACFCDAREYLAKYGVVLLCNGARLDAYPSRMSRDMGDGTLIYITVMGKQARDEDLVNLFDEAPADKIASVQEQREFHRRWLDHFGSGR